MNTLVTWAWNILISIDQFANTVFAPLLNKVLNPEFKFGNPDETLSSVFGKNVRAGSCRACYVICRILNMFQKDHCKKSIEDDEL